MSEVYWHLISLCPLQRSIIHLPRRGCPIKTLFRPWRKENDANVDSFPIAEKIQTSYILSEEDVVGKKGSEAANKERRRGNGGEERFVVEE